MASNTGLTLLGQPSNLNYPGLTPNNGVQVPGTPEFGTPATTTTGGSGSGSTTNPNAALSAASIANTNKSIEQLPTILQSALDANNTQFQNAESGFNAQEQQQRGQYDTGTTTNQQNYDANLMAALRTGANGLSGLLSILRGTGVENWAKEAVGNTTNSDIRTGLTTHDTNQTALDSSISNFLTDLAEKRNQNQQTLRNNETAARAQNAVQLQDLYTKLAGYYADMGDNASATTYLNMAGDQTPAIAQFSTAPVSSYDTTPITVKAPEIAAFSAPTKQSITSSDTATPTAGIFTIADTRKKLAGA